MVSRNNNAAGRSPPFSILTHHAGRFLATFYAIWILLAGLLSYAQVATADNPPLVWQETATIIIIAAAVTVGIALPLAIGIVEGLPMVLAKLYTDRVREEARSEGRDEGRQEGRSEERVERDRLWEAWNERRLAAEREGRPFTEPTPSRNGTQGADSG